MTTTERQEIPNRYYKLSVMPPHGIGKELEKARAYDYDVAALLAALDELQENIKELD